MESNKAWVRRHWTLTLVTAAALLEGADENLLPATYREVGAALGASPTALGSITMCRALAQALCYPLSMWAAARSDRARVVAGGTFLCAVTTVIGGASNTFIQMAIARGFNGVGLAFILPAVYSIVADHSDDDTRGTAFGWVVMAQSVGAAMGTSLGVLLAPTSFFGVPGWRLAFHGLALVGVALALSTWLLAADSSPGIRTSDTVASVAEIARGVLGVPTFWIIVAQGAASQVPWLALTSMPMWLELVGLTHWETTVVTSLKSSTASPTGSARCSRGSPGTSWHGGSPTRAVSRWRRRPTRPSFRWPPFSCCSHARRGGRWRAPFTPAGFRSWASLWFGAWSPPATLSSRRSCRTRRGRQCTRWTCASRTSSRPSGRPLWASWRSVSLGTDRGRRHPAAPAPRPQLWARQSSRRSPCRQPSAASRTRRCTGLTPRTDGARRWWPRPCRRRRAGTRRTAVKQVDLLLDLPHLMMASTRPYYLHVVTDDVNYFADKLYI